MAIILTEQELELLPFYPIPRELRRLQNVCRKKIYNSWFLVEYPNDCIGERVTLIIVKYNQDKLVNGGNSIGEMMAELLMNHHNISSLAWMLYNLM